MSPRKASPETPRFQHARFRHACFERACSGHGRHMDPVTQVGIRIEDLDEFFRAILDDIKRPRARQKKCHRAATPPSFRASRSNSCKSNYLAAHYVDAMVQPGEFSEAVGRCHNFDPEVNRPWAVWQQFYCLEAPFFSGRSASLIPVGSRVLRIANLHRLIPLSCRKPPTFPSNT